MSHVILFSIGPVQDFIASARRFRDLWFGSWVLSELSKAAARAVAEAEGLDALVFPAPGAESDLAPDSRLSVANKVLARIQGDPADLARRAEAAVRTRLRAIAHEAFQRVDGPGFDWESADRQVEDLLEWHWAAAAERSTYAEARRQAEALLAMRKNTRDFNPSAWGADRPKSSLDGAREAVIEPSALKASSAELHRRYGLRAGEQLCGVGLLKRLGGDPEAVPSTSHMAALGSLRGADGARLAAAAADYDQALADLGVRSADRRRRPVHPVLGALPGHLLFEERLSDVVPPEQAGRAREALRRFLARAGLGAPQPYYAVLIADGDRMGVAIDHQVDARAHRDLSERLAGFAAEAESVLARHDGFVVYAGGDDVLALMPLHTVLDGARALADAFAERMRSFTSPQGAPTLSVGVAVGHQLDPAGDTLALARKAERAAKRSRNALGLAIQKRGGGEQLLSGEWNTLDTRLAAWQTLLREDALPDGVAYELRALGDELGADAPPGAYQAEVRRILGRKRTSDGRPVDADQQRRLVEAAVDREAVAALAEELIAARLFVTH